ncbi:ATP-binding protein [Bacteroides ihuae]|uniref:ATP-binding protein n=1 Tax=Bacteroides ihuae TaxID=1852362 RepID=UPI0008D905A2|nr:ATP-binding protein [Bacteroides ihuae]
MSLIRNSNELVLPSNIKMMVYGQAGMGKSTYALSTPKPLLFDFDNGVKRINGANLVGVDTVQISKWQDVLDVLKENLSGYQTIVVDTIGKMMDYIITHRCGNRVPVIKDWNGINQEFSNFMRNLSDLNKHVVFVAHRDTRKEGDDTVFIPSLREKSYNSIVTELDLLGYIEAKTENGRTKRTITFDPTTRNDGKNTCNLPSVMEIPTIIDVNGNLTHKNTAIQDYVINPYLGMLAAKKAETEQYVKVMAEIKEQIELITDAKSANDFASRVKAFDHVGSSLDMTRALFSAKVNSLNLIMDKETNKYIQKELQPSLL